MRIGKGKKEPGSNLSAHFIAPCLVSGRLPGGGVERARIVLKQIILFFAFFPVAGAFSFGHLAESRRSGTGPNSRSEKTQRPILSG